MRVPRLPPVARDDLNSGVGLNSEAVFHGSHSIAGDSQLCVGWVLEDQDHLAAEPRVDFVNPISVDECGAMNTQELLGVEASLKFDDGLVHAVTASVDDGEGELVLRDEMRDVIEREKGDTLADARSNTLRKALMAFAERCGKFLKEIWKIGVALPLGDDDRAQAPKFLNRPIKAFGLDRFQKIVDGIRLEGAERVLIVCGGEDDGGLASEVREQLEAVHAGHLNVEEENVDVGGRTVEVVDRLPWASCGSCHVNRGEGGKESLEALDGEWFIIDEVGAKRSGFHGGYGVARMSMPILPAMRGWRHRIDGKRDASDGFRAIASDVKLSAIFKKELKPGGEVSQAVLRRDGRKRETGAIVYDFQAKGPVLNGSGDMD